ncbi:PfkB family carbohydrate kinase [Fibrella aquatica]|uniref:PfkB family carbohydrate kinase n=1 Tax=Fibrella aquatica TaxID=3242487 RepID=UPI003520BAA3
MIDICTIGHLSLDKVTTPRTVAYMPGGTSFYFSKALSQADLTYQLITALSSKENYIVDELRSDGIDVYAIPSPHTVYFQNAYDEDLNNRQQHVLRKAIPFSSSQLPPVTAKIFHLGPLLSDDIPSQLLEELAQKGLVSLDIQGYLRRVWRKKVIYQDWADKKRVLPKVHTLKANEFEMQLVTGQKDILGGATYLADLGVKEVIITLGDRGSLIYTGGTLYKIPSFKPPTLVDTTGCGDTYMAGYLLKRVKGSSVQEAGEYGALLAGLKVGFAGPIPRLSTLNTDLASRVDW